MKKIFFFIVGIASVSNMAVRAYHYNFSSVMLYVQTILTIVFLSISNIKE